ncbi:hypothetical protein ABTY96_46430 [Streptomyces sp. NPDC096057]|uniref:hypothetical protein n=1 Tax=Streptomyces sp. NPDC096057 TaxID=3155543 RepID=UPI00332D9322
MKAQPPSVGRIVHYVSHGTPVREDGSQAFPPACRAAVVTEVDPADRGRVGLAVLNPTGQFFHPLAAGGCEHVAVEEQPPTGGTWHWPERV